jgi:hypothetical protein
MLLLLPSDGESENSPSPFVTVPGLSAFITRFSERIVEMALDVDDDTATVAVVVATILLRFSKKENLFILFFW